MKKKDILVLVVEDDPSYLKVLCEAVKKKGYAVIEASTPEEALQITKIKTINAAVIDCMLPKKNGIELSKELREMGFTELPIFLMSGIFKDKAFAADAIKKTGAKDFLTKPFDLNILFTALDKELESVVEIPKLPLHTLMSKPMASSRQRLRAIDKIEEINGLDIPFIVNILLESETDGHLNIFGDDGEIYGISFMAGKIVKVDSGNTKDIFQELLINSGFINPEELSAFRKESKKGDLIKNLIKENRLSPHVQAVVKSEQMVKEISKMICDTKMQINFSVGKTNDPGAEIQLNILMPLFFQSIQNKATLPWLQGFYEQWMNHSMKRGGDIDDSHQALSFPLIRQNKELVDKIFSEASIQQIIDEGVFPEDLIFKTVHFFAILKVIVFDEEKSKNKSSQEIFERLSRIYYKIEHQDIYTIYKYFGASDRCKTDEVDKIYKDFAKVNHPDKLSSKGLKPDQLEIVNKLFSLLTNGHDILTNETKRQTYLDKQDQKVAETQMKGEKLLDNGMNSLRKGQFQEALMLLSEADNIHSSQESKLYLYWAELKMNGDQELPDDLYNKISEFVDSFPAADRKTTDYNMLSGLLKKACKDYDGAKKYFEKALDVDEKFLDARRELMTLGKVSGAKTETKSILEQDLSVVIGNFSNKKKSG
ncbi:MAG: response regulator [Bdellovibrionaceae bacterium]|nr:response regulator [Pseudobdellovibrionaceae bacterium]